MSIISAKLDTKQTGANVPRGFANRPAEFFWRYNEGMGEKPPVEPSSDQPAEESGDTVVHIERFFKRHPEATFDHPELTKKLLEAHVSDGPRYFYADEDDQPDPPDDSPDDSAS